MAKNELGFDFGNPVGGDFLIDTDSGKVIPQEGKKIDPEEKKSEEEKDDPKKEDGLIEILDKKDDKKIDAEEEIDDEGNDDDPNRDNDSSSLPQFKVLVKALHEKGIISNLDEKLLDSEDKEDADKLFELIKGEIDKNTKDLFDEKISGLPDNIKEMIGAGGVKEQVAGDLMQLKSDIESLSGITDEKIVEDVELQKNIIKESLRKKGYNDDKIAKRITQFEDLGALEDEAKDSLKDIISDLKSQETKLISDAEAKDKSIKESRKKELNKIKKDIFDADSILPEIKLTEKEKQQVFDSMTKIVDKDADGNPLNAVMATRLKNPMAFEKALHYYHALGLFNIDDDGNFKPNLSKIKTTAKASAVDELNKALKKEQRTQAGRPARENRMDRDALKKQIERMKSSFPL